MRGISFKTDRHQIRMALINIIILIKDLINELERSQSSTFKTYTTYRISSICCRAAIKF